MPDVWRVASPTARQGAKRRRGEALDARIAALAAKQGGVISRKQLIGLGFSASGIAARVARGALHVIHREVYAVGHPIVHGLGLDHAALLACAPRASAPRTDASAPRTPLASAAADPSAALVARSHRSAGVALQLRSWASCTVELTAGAGRRSRPGIVVHRQRLHPDEVAVVDGLPTTTVARTVFDLAEVLTREQHLRTWQEGERLQLIDVRAVRAVAERNPGRHALKVILPLLATRSLPGAAETRSPLEADFLPFAAAWLSAWPPPLVNSWAHGFEIDSAGRTHASAWSSARCWPRGGARDDANGDARDTCGDLTCPERVSPPHISPPAANSPHGPPPAWPAAAR